MDPDKVLKLLSRSDKWYLGGGNRLLWAPPFPEFLDHPGLWDKAHYYNYEFQPLFTWSLLDAEGRQIPVKSVSRTWNPAMLEQRFEIANSHPALNITEEKSVLPSDVAIDTVRIANRSRKTLKLHFIAWTLQENYPSKQTTWMSDVAHQAGTLAWSKHLKPQDRPELEVGCAFSMSRKPKTFAVNLSEGSAILPRWELTPFNETFAKTGLPNELKIRGVNDDGLLYLALHCEVILKALKEETITIALAMAPSIAEAKQNLSPILEHKQPVQLSELSWRDHFQNVPFFHCSDDFLTRYYWYRWYGLKLNTLYGSEGNYQYPAVCEGIGYFRAPISYSAQCHMLENRWMHDPELARGSLLTFIDNQRDDGGFRGYIDINHYRQEMFYHANWGNALVRLHELHPSLDFLDSVYGGLKKYASYFDRERDEEVSGLYDIDNHYETGQEYMHRYVAVDPNADKDNWGEVFRLKGVDVSVYLYELKRTLARTAELLGKTDDAELWTLEADRIRTAIRETMWDLKEEMFFDVNPKTGKQTKVKAATCFYPYFTDIVDASHLPGLKRHLLNPKEFWTPYPVPSSSFDDEFFSATPEWKGKRMNCPWNGRVWPMTNSHIAETLAACAIRFNDSRLRTATADFVSRFVRMMFFDRDETRPNCFEHYNPISGAPSIYRGIDDYQHSWVNDLIIKYVCGIRPEEFSVVVDPFPFGLKQASIERVLVRGRTLNVEIMKSRFSVWLDGTMHIESRIGKPVILQI